MSRPARYRGFRAPSARLPTFDDGAGAFFVTVATRGREPWLGRLGRGGAVLSAAGRVVWEGWRRTAEVRPTVTLDALVVMPDHVHGVLWIDGTTPPGDGPSREDVETPRWGVLRSEAHPPAHPAPRAVPPHRTAPWRPATLGTVVNQFKGACTKRIRGTDPAFAWQAGFWDVVIRDARHLEASRRYVLENPLRAGRG